MNERIKRLRDHSINTTPSLSIERAQLLTHFYKSGEAERVSIPVSRALAFKYLLEHKEICIRRGELIVGERGPGPVSAPTYPEICTHTLDDLEVLNSRDKISFSVNEKTRTIMSEEIIPFWSGKSIRDKIFNSVDQEWKDAYEAGVFTEFMEQRAPGHTAGGAHLFQKGFLDFKNEIEQSRANLDFYNDPQAFNKNEELKAMAIAADAIILYSKRHAERAEAMEKIEEDPKYKQELLQIATICNNIPANAPQNMHEALQHYWFIHLGIITELNTWDSFNPGRLDQNLYPYFKKDIDSGVLTRESAKELLSAFWIKFNNQPAPPKVGVTAQESGTYTDFCLINIGGLKEDGTDAVNDLSYLILDVIEKMRILQPSSMVQISKKTPNKFLKRVLEIVKTGFGQPSIFNSDAIIQELTNQGKSLKDARNGGASGCVESGAFGKESYILTGYFNFTKVMELTLFNGIDPKTDNQIGLQTGKSENFDTFDDLFNAFVKQMNYFIDIKIKGNNIIERLWAETLPSPFMSILTHDCIKNGIDYNNGGARYNTSYIQGVGIGSITDSMTSIKYNVFDKKHISMKELIKLLKSNFKDKESLREDFVYNTPKYGNDNDYADTILKQIFEEYYNAINGRPNTKGGTYHINLLPTTSHVYFGSTIGATPDGRKAFTPLSEGISPVGGCDINGPTAAIKSAVKIDHLRTGGTLLNQKFTPMLLNDNTGIEKIAYLVRSYFSMDGHHIQFNVVSAETLKDAKKYPEKHRNLIVRVAGYSDYFVNLSNELQDEIINRTEHMNF